VITLPTCAVCRKPVDELVQGADPSAGRLVFTARCHGAAQRVEIDQELLAVSVTIVVGEAFATQALQSAALPEDT
jgi:hypothetical protein